MGNCPSEFSAHPSATARCVAKCPADKGYEYRNVSGALKCVYKNDPSIAVDLTSLPAMGASATPGVKPPQGSMEVLKTSNPQLYKQYADELARFNQAFAVANAKIDKTEKATAAFKALQDAENARDQAPDAYQAARVAYYTLVKGDAWLDEERTRVAKAEVDPVVDAYTARYTDVKNRMSQQTKTLDIVNAVKDNLLSIQDEFGRTVGVFNKQLNEVKNQINIERHKKTEEVTGIWSFVETALNILLVLALVFAIVSVGRAMFATPTPTSIPQATYTR